MLDRLGVSQWLNAGHRGRGVKIAILDTGFRGYQSFLGKALPAHVLCRSFRADGNLEERDSQHGILCAEVVHTLAPDAELLFANWDIEKPEQFLAAIKWAREKGCRILSCSVVMPSWSDGAGKGEVHEKLTQLLGNGSHPTDLLCFASAGNTIERHWAGNYHDGGDGWHEWKPGKKDNGITPWGKFRCSAELYWQPGADYDLTVYDEEDNRVVGMAHTDHHQGNRCSAVVYYQPVAGHTYKAQVRLVGGHGGYFHLCTMESSLELTTSRGSVCFPADNAEVVAMGAEDGSRRKTWYSACGPNCSAIKPDFMAPVPFHSSWRERPFAGTSAASPQGAALAALLWARHPNWTATQIRATLRQTAEDLAEPGPDLETGFGLLHLPHP